MFTLFNLFLLCAVFAGTIFVLQFILLLIGVDGDGADFDFDADLPDDVDFGDGEHGGHGSSWLFGAISMKTVVAALTFFGLAGMATMKAEQGALISVVVAVVVGLAAMYGVHFLMQSLHKLSHDGTTRIRNAVGLPATVYIPIPANEDGSGKIQIRLQGQLAELAAMTAADRKLKTGSKVRVVGIVTGSTVMVEPISQPAINDLAAEPKTTETA